MNQSYAQTEMYFIQHSDHLMPRVHQMRTDLAQYYHSTNPSLRLSYITSEAEKVNFQINGTDLLMRDFNVFCTTKTNHRQILDQLKQMALTNNTTGASIYDLGNIIKATNIAEVTNTLKDAETKQKKAKEDEMKNQQAMQQQQLEAQQQQLQQTQQFQAQQAEAERQKDITVAEIRASGYGAQMDINQNMQSDFKDAMDDMRKRDEYREQMNFKKEQVAVQNAAQQSKLAIDREKLATQRQIAEKNLEVARENKNRYDVQPAPKPKKKKE